MIPAGLCWVEWKLSQSCNASSQHGFVPIQEFGTETIDLDFDLKSTKKGMPKDVVGLSDDEDEGEGGDFDTKSSRSPKGSPKDELQKEDSSFHLSASINSRGGFRPMAEFGTETINLDGEDAIGGLDAVGLSDDEDNLMKAVSEGQEDQESS